MSDQPSLPAGLAEYLDARAGHRARQIADVLGALTPREQALVREAAVMGYVRGVCLGEPIPPDSTIVADVVLGCLTFPDQYPTIARGER